MVVSIWAFLLVSWGLGGGAVFEQIFQLTLQRKAWHLLHPVPAEVPCKLKSTN